MSELEGKVALVTGARGGLGTWVTESFLKAGAAVAGVSRTIRQSDFPHPAFVAIEADLSSGESARRIAGEVVDRFGRIDILAHVMGGFAGGMPVAETGDPMLEKMLGLNLWSAFHMARAVIPYMRRQGGGRIVAIGSRAAVEPQALVGVYGVSKAALVSLMGTIAVENKDAGITANVILSGTMDTPANRAADPSADFSRWVPPARIAGLILWLASDAASHVSGARIPVYGRDL